MGDYVRADPPAFLALNRGKRSISIDLKNPAGRDAFLHLSTRADVVLESFRPGVMDRLGRRLRAPARGEPAARLLRDHRLRAGRAVRRAGRPRHELPGADRAARPDRRPGRPAGPGGRPDRRPRRRCADGRVRHPGGAARARRVRRGPARRRVDDRRRALVAGDGCRAPARRRRGAGARTRAARGRAHLLPPVPLRRRLGGVRRAGAEVLARLVRGRRPARARRAPVRRRSAPTPTARSRRCSPSARRAEWEAFNDEHDCCLEPVLSTRRGARVRARPRARDGGGAPKLLGTPVKLSRTPAEPADRRPGARRRHRRGARRGRATAPTRSPRCARPGRWR